MGNRYASAAYRELGGMLRRVREKAGLSGTELARLLDWPMTRAERKQGFYLSDEGIGGSLQSLIFHESSAEHSIIYEPLVIHGLLQTPDYANTLVSAVNSEDLVAGTVRTRMERRRILSLPTPGRFTIRSRHTENTG